jgi:hypothetical protein
MDGKKDDKNSVDELIKDYNAILRESTLLTTVSGFIFGFLFNTTINTPASFTPVDSIILTIALFTSTCSICLFVMPVVYHNIQYPYSNLEKFKKRSHNFVAFGLVPAGITLYLGLIRFEVRNKTRCHLRVILTICQYFLRLFHLP